MKLFYQLSRDGRYCENRCDFYKDKMIGSVACKQCEHCYGASILTRWGIICNDNEKVHRPMHYVKCAMYQTPKFTKSMKFKILKRCHELLYSWLHLQ